MPMGWLAAHPLSSPGAPMVSLTPELEENTREWSYESPVSATRRSGAMPGHPDKRPDAPIRRTPVPPAPELPTPSNAATNRQVRVVFLSALIGALGMALVLWAIG